MNTTNLVDNNKFTKKVLIINSIIFALYTIPTLISYASNSENFSGIIALYLVAIQCLLLLIIGIIDFFIIYLTKSTRSSSAYFASVGLLFVLGIISYLILMLITAN